MKDTNKIFLTEDESVEAQCFKTLFDILSGPVVLVTSNDLKIFMIS